MSACAGYGLDWRPDLPDPRDLTPNSEAVAALLRPLRPLRRLPDRIDWREFFPPAESAVPPSVSAADACVQMVRYFERRASGRVVDPARRFLHQSAQRLLGAHGPCGCELRTTLKALVRFGAPPRRHWPDEPSGDAQPDAFVYAAAERWLPLSYVRLDDRTLSAEIALKTLRAYLAAGFAVVFGLPLFAAASAEAEMVFPTLFDSVQSGLAAVVAGYDDTHRLRSGKGALLVRMPWGAAWGEAGYGWLPYAYVRERLAIDFWTLLQPQWLESGEFLRPA